MTKFIVVMDTPSIKKYVFEASALKDIRGASAILDGLNRGWILSDRVGKEWKVSVDEEVAYKQQEEIYRTFLENLGLTLSEFVYANGGSGLMIVEAENEGDLERFEKELQKIYRKETCDAICPLMAWVEYKEDELQKSIRDAHWKLRRKKASRRIYSAISNPWGKQDEEVNDRIAEKRYCQMGEEKWISEVSYRRKEFSEKRRRIVWREFQENIKKDFQWEKIGPPASLEDIAKLREGDKEDNIAVVYADGDSMNKIIKSFTTIKEYKKFSKVIDSAVRKATFFALKETFKEELKDGTARFDIILLGGDDILIVLPSQYSADFVIKAAEKFKEEVKGKEEKDHKYSISFGISVAGSHSPFSQMVEQAEACLKSAKKKKSESKEVDAKEKCFVDFHINRSGFYPDIHNYRDKEFIQKQEKKKEQNYQKARKLICRPFSLKKFGDYCDAAKKLKKESVPASRLYYIAESLKEGRNRGHIGWIQGVGRAKDGQKKALCELLSCWITDRKDCSAIGTIDFSIEPWRKLTKEEAIQENLQIEYICGFHDILEIYDLVRGVENDSNNRI